MDGEDRMDRDREWMVYGAAATRKKKGDVTVESTGRKTYSEAHTSTDNCPA